MNENRPKKFIQLKNNSNKRNIGDSSLKKSFKKADISSRANIEIIDKNGALHKQEKKENQINNPIRKNKDEKNGKNIYVRYNFNNQKEKIIFWKFLIYKCSCGKKNYNLQLYESFREKIISVENLIQNNIKINDLLKLKDKIYKA